MSLVLLIMRFWKHLMKIESISCIPSTLYLKIKDTKLMVPPAPQNGQD